MQKLRSFLPGGSNGTSKQQKQIADTTPICPEIGFQITIDKSQQQINNSIGNAGSAGTTATSSLTTVVPELNVHLIAARHLPALFGFKIVQGYLIKVKLFPGSKRLDSCIQTNSWPKFNETFKFPLAPDIKSALKHSSSATPRRSTKSFTEFTPEEIFAGQFVVFTVYALLELPPASFNRFNKTYRSLKDKSSNFVQKVVESGVNKTKDDKENSTNSGNNAKSSDNSNQKLKRKPSDVNPRDSIPPLTISESRRNIGSVTCYLEPRLFKQNSRTGVYSTEELWYPIKDINTTVVKNTTNNLANAVKGVVEIVLEVRDLSENTEPTTPTADDVSNNSNSYTSSNNNLSRDVSSANFNGSAMASTNGATKNPQWNRMTSEVKRKMGISNVSKSQQHNFVLRVTTARMRCNHKVKDELEHTAGSVYVKTTVFEHGIYIDSWKSPNFYPSLSTKWDVGVDTATLEIPIKSLDNLQDILIRTTLATKTKMGKKLVLGTVIIGASAETGGGFLSIGGGGGGASGSGGSGAEHMRLLCETPVNERVPMWHAYQ